MPLDLASLKSVNAFCDEFKKKGLELSVLVCNAGLMRPPKRLETEDGLERQFQVCHSTCVLISLGIRCPTKEPHNLPPWLLSTPEESQHS